MFFQHILINYTESDLYSCPVILWFVIHLFLSSVGDFKSVILVPLNSIREFLREAHRTMPMAALSYQTNHGRLTIPAGAENQKLPKQVTLRHNTSLVIGLK